MKVTFTLNGTAATWSGPPVTRLAAASVEKSLQLLPRSARPRTRAVNDDF